MDGWTVLASLARHEIDDAFLDHLHYEAYSAEMIMLLFLLPACLPWVVCFLPLIMVSAAMMEGPQRRAEGTTVTIEGLEYSVMQDDLYELFQSIGQVVKVWIDYDSTDRSAGSGGVVFASTADAEQAVKRYNGKLLDGKQLSLELDPYAQPNTSSSGGFGGMMPTRGRGRGRGRALLQPARGRGGPSGW
mmetsp:Transcript_35336/g.101604  ORF Transcript_35336/g.101604 Transcript_35336/m.101604 type:complete len:189 (-) Transcript_35336:464-1030(-)